MTLILLLYFCDKRVMQLRGKKRKKGGGGKAEEEEKDKKKGKQGYAGAGRQRYRKEVYLRRQLSSQ
jgi:hypothetical protein